MRIHLLRALSIIEINEQDRSAPPNRQFRSAFKFDFVTGQTEGKTEDGIHEVN